MFDKVEQHCKNSFRQKVIQVSNLDDKIKISKARLKKLENQIEDYKKKEKSAIHELERIKKEGEAEMG